MAVSAPAGAADTLRLLTWGSYAPENIIEMFEEETGIEVEVTFSNNEEMISKLRATGGGGFDLAQPSHDRIHAAQLEYNIYKPMDLSKIDTSVYDPSLLGAVKANTTIDGEVYSVPHFWGTSGLVVNKARAPDLKSFADLCDPQYEGRVSMRLKRTILIGMGYAMGEDPFGPTATSRSTNGSSTRRPRSSSRARRTSRPTGRAGTTSRTCSAPARSSPPTPGTGPPSS